PALPRGRDHRHPPRPHPRGRRRDDRARDDHPGRHGHGQGAGRGRDPGVTTFSGPPPETEGGIGALTLGGFLAEVVGHHGDREAVAWRRAGSAATTRWTYEQLGREARRIGRALLAAGVGKGTRVGLLMGNRPEWVAAAYGVAMAGGRPVPVNTLYEPPEPEHALSHSDTAVLLLQEGLGRHAYLDEVRAMDGRLPHLRRVVCLGRGSWAAFSADAAKVTERQLDACAAGV